MGRSYEGTNFVTGMRAYAALGVTLIHCGGAGLRNFGDFGNELVDLGATGVYVFFVISGFSVTASFEKLSSFPEFFVRRFMRLAPVYYAFLVVALLLMHLGVIGSNYWARNFEVPVDAYNLLMHVLFLGFLDHRVNNSILGVEWSLSVEVFWYLLMPPILMCVSKRYSKLGWFIFASLAIYFVNKELVDLLAGSASQYVVQWSPLTYAPAFMLGVAAYHIRNRRPLLCDRRANACLAAVFALLMLQCVVSLMEIRLLIPLLTFCVLLAGHDNHGLSRIVFNNMAAIFLGTISYSIYLWHPIVIQLLEAQSMNEWLREGSLVLFLAVCGTTVLLSMITYRFIEIPSNNWGRVLATRFSTTAKAEADGRDKALGGPVLDDFQSASIASLRGSLGVPELGNSAEIAFDGELIDNSQLPVLVFAGRFIVTSEDQQSDSGNQHQQNSMPTRPVHIAQSQES